MTPKQFFFANDGCSYDPKTETKIQGRWKCASRLADAEKTARDQNMSFAWSEDDVTSEEFSDKKPFYPLYQCLAYDESGKVVGSLGGVDFGRKGNPHSDPYRRVVEAQLALEAIGAII